MERGLVEFPGAKWRAACQVPKPHLLRVTPGAPSGATPSGTRRSSLNKRKGTQRLFPIPKV